jgi:DNA-binding NtrC family response regulator
VKPFREAKADFLRDYLTELLQEAKGNRTLAAEIAGVNRTALQEMLRRVGLSRVNSRTQHRGNWNSLSP